MKKIIIFSNILIILLFFLSCTVNDYTGLIRVENHTEEDLKNVYIGSTLITSYVAPGNYVDYWYSWEINGKITTEGVDVNDIQEDTKFKLKPGYWVFITAHTFDEHEKLYEVQISIKKQGSEEDDEWHN